MRVSSRSVEPPTFRTLGVHYARERSTVAAMTNVTNIRTEHDESSSALVAAEVRGFLAKRRIPTYKVHERLGNSRSYWQRRISGDLPLNIEDLEQLGWLVGQPLTAFIPTDLPPAPDPETPTTDYRYEVSPIVFLKERRSARLVAA